MKLSKTYNYVIGTSTPMILDAPGDTGNAGGDIFEFAHGYADILVIKIPLFLSWWEGSISITSRSEWDTGLMHLLLSC